MRRNWVALDLRNTRCAVLDGSHTVTQWLTAYELTSARTASAYDMRGLAQRYMPGSHRDQTAQRVRNTLNGDCCYAYHCKLAELVKLGRTSDVFRRWAKLETEAERSLQLVAVWQVDNCRSFERTLHERFSADRRIGEWFNAEPVLLMLESFLHTAPGKSATHE